MSLDNKTVLITGAAGGLGSALSMQCAKQGANLVLLDVNRRKLTALSDAITAEGLPAPGLYPMDLSSVGIDDIQSMAEVIASEYGGLDALIHCALAFEGLQLLEQVAPHEWLKSMQVNLNTPWLLTCACLPMLRASENGHLYFLLDDEESQSGAYWGAYGAAKAALVALVAQFDATLSNTEIAVRGIYPGAMRSDFRAKVYHSEDPASQPDPAAVAGKIAELLVTGKQDSDLFVKLG
jgi:NAD(P)-dependent dehydrogenase (short-subunit alcohol dehydrogenase family)